MLLLQRYTKDNPTKKEIIQWQNGLSVHLLFSMYGEWLEDITGEKKSMKNYHRNYHRNYHHNYQFHAKPTISSGEVDNGEKL